MAVGFSPEENELAPDPFTGGGTAVGAPPGAPMPAAPVMSPIGPVPADTPGLPPPTDVPGTLSPPQTAQPGANAQLTPGANDADSLATPAGMENPAGAPEAPIALPPRPTRPPLTGDPAKDLQASIQYGRDLDDWHERRLQATTSAQNKISSDAAAKELALAKEEQAHREAIRKQQEQERVGRQQAIDEAVAERKAAHGDIENARFRGDEHAGRKIFATLLSGIGQAISAAGGHQTENMAQKVINDRMDREYDHEQKRLANANESVLQARYGYKDTADNQRAALNDMDADFAAKHKLIAEEAAAQMKARGISPEIIAQSELVYGNEQKANQYEANIHTREIEAGRKATLDAATIEKDKAQAEAAAALARFRDRRTAGHGTGTGKGGTSKLSAKAQKDEIKDIEAAGRDTSKVLEGSARSKGAIEGYRAANAVVGELKKAAASGDPDMMKIAVMHAQEQSTRFLTGAAPTQQTFEIQHALASTPEQLEAKLGGILGQPTESKSYVLRMARNIQAIADQQKDVVEQSAGPLRDRFNSIVRSDEGKRRAQGILDQLFGHGAYPLAGGGAGGGPVAAPKIDKAMIDKAKAAYDDPQAPVEAKRAAGKILSAAGVI